MAQFQASVDPRFTAAPTAAADSGRPQPQRRPGQVLHRLPRPEPAHQRPEPSAFGRGRRRPAPGRHHQGGSAHSIHHRRAGLLGTAQTVRPALQGVAGIRPDATQRRLPQRPGRRGRFAAQRPAVQLRKPAAPGTAPERRRHGWVECQRKL